MKVGDLMGDKDSAITTIEMYEKHPYEYDELESELWELINSEIEDDKT